MTTRTKTASKYEPDTFYTVRLKRPVDVNGIRFRACDRAGRPLDHRMKSSLVERLGDAVARVD